MVLLYLLQMVLLYLPQWPSCYKPITLCMEKVAALGPIKSVSLYLKPMPLGSWSPNLWIKLHSPYIFSSCLLYTYLELYLIKLIRRTNLITNCILSQTDRNQWKSTATVNQVTPQLQRKYPFHSQYRKATRLIIFHPTIFASYCCFVFVIVFIHFNYCSFIDLHVNSAYC